jgi:plastocyanin
MRRMASIAAALFGASAFSLMTASATSAAGGTVTIKSGSGCTGGATFCYAPSALSVTDGSTVTWTDSTGAPHTVTRCDATSCGSLGPGTGTDTSFTSLSVTPGNSVSQTFHGKGTYNYFCTIHGFAAMHGTITVTAPK